MRGEPPHISLKDDEDISLCEALDRILNKGAVVVGELTISVANVDLIYLGLQVILTSIETGRQIATGKTLNDAAIRVGLGTEVMIDETCGTSSNAP
jgi:hypothetical protein